MGTPTELAILQESGAVREDFEQRPVAFPSALWPAAEVQAARGSGIAL